MNSLPMRAASAAPSATSSDGAGDGRDAEAQGSAQQRLVDAARAAHDDVLVLRDLAAHEHARRRPART